MSIYVTTTPVADQVPFNNTGTGLTSTTVQGAIAEVATGTTSSTFQQCDAYLTGSIPIFVSYIDLVDIDQASLTQQDL